MTRAVDIVILGAGIAGLWCFNRLKRAGYDVLLLEREAIGCGQTIAAQGIIHSGAKYPVLNRSDRELVRKIRQMPARWRAALNGDGDVDLSALRAEAEAHLMLARCGPQGLVRRIFARCMANADGVRRREWPAEFSRLGFEGIVDALNEPVVSVPGLLRALGEPFSQSVRALIGGQSADPLDLLSRMAIEPRAVVVTAAGGNEAIAKRHGHADGMETQCRPLLQGMLRPAPFPLWAHFFEAAWDKPAVSVTTHRAQDGRLVWYFGGLAAERPKDADPESVYLAVRRTLAAFFPRIDVSEVQWASWPIDRVERRATNGRIPSQPAVHPVGNFLYCWPTKLTFTPLLGDMVVAELDRLGIAPSHRETDFSDLPPVDYAVAPWDKAVWTS